MLGRLINDFLSFIVMVILIDCAIFIAGKVITKRIVIQKIPRICICIIIQIYIHVNIFWYFIPMIIIFIKIIRYIRQYFNNIKQLKWRKCYSGKYIDLVKKNKIMDGCTMCALTFDEFSPTTRTVALTCRHAFTDDELIHKWLNIHQSCPTCRRKV
jgi:hypothetical protein